MNIINRLWTCIGRYVIMNSFKIEVFLKYSFTILNGGKLVLTKTVFYFKTSLHLQSWHSFFNHCFMLTYFTADGCFICLLCQFRPDANVKRDPFYFWNRLFFRIKELGNTREGDQVTQVLALTCPCRFFQVQCKKGTHAHLSFGPSTSVGH